MLVRSKDMPKGRDYLKLSSTGNDSKEALQFAHWMCAQWAPSRAVSYTIQNYRYTDYFGRKSAAFQGYTLFDVYYFSTKREGDYLVEDAPELP